MDLTEKFEIEEESGLSPTDKEVITELGFDPSSYTGTKERAFLPDLFNSGEISQDSSTTMEVESVSTTDRTYKSLTAYLPAPTACSSQPTDQDRPKEESEAKSEAERQVVHEAISVRVRLCPTCKKLFGRIQDLNEHIRSVHLHEKNHRCAKCGYACFSKGSFNKHLRRKTPCKPDFFESGEISKDNSMMVEADSEIHFNTLEDADMGGCETTPWDLSTLQESDFETIPKPCEDIDMETSTPTEADAGKDLSTFFDYMDMDNQQPPFPEESAFEMIRNTDQVVCISSSTQIETKSQIDLNLQKECKPGFEEEKQLPPSSPRGAETGIDYNILEASSYVNEITSGVLSMEGAIQVDIEPIEHDSSERSETESENQSKAQVKEKPQAQLEPKIVNGGFECHVCQRVFTYRWYLNKHLELCTPHKCERCEMAFRLRGELSAHIMEKHEGWEKKYSCPKCTHSFFMEKRVGKHIKKDHGKDS